MGTVTPNISIYIPAPGETNYDAAFAAGMVNIDQHDHSGGPNKGVPLTGTGIAAGAVTFDKLNANVADNTTGIGTHVGPTANQLYLLGLLSSIFNLGTDGFIVRSGSNAVARSITGTSGQVVVTNQDGTGGNPQISLAPIVSNPTQPAFFGVVSATPAFVGDNAFYTIPCGTENFDQGSNFSTVTSEFTAPVTGIYNFSCAVRVSTFDAVNSDPKVVLTLDVFNGVSDVFYDIYFDQNLPINNTITTIIQFSGSQLIKMTAGWTIKAQLKVAQASLAKTIDLTSGNFTGYLVA